MARPLSWRRELSAPLHALQHELNRLFDEYWNPARIVASHPAPVDLEPTAWSPAIDLFETPSEVVLLAELPGVEPQSIDLFVTGNLLTLRGEKSPGAIAEGHASVQERQFGTFHRQVALSTEVDLDAAHAEIRDGVLRVRIPKQEASQPRTIPIRPG
jgi:HSP20 family protein